jgi:hypothetical protein
MDLLSTNMKKLYEESEWGWKEKNKTDEMMDESAWYLVAREAESGSPVAFSHFRYDMDYDDEVLYVYEIQLEQGVRRKGLGRFMMMVRSMGGVFGCSERPLELVARQGAQFTYFQELFLT